MDLDDSYGEIRELYSNYFRVGFNTVEFLLDFGRHSEGSEDRIYQRIITVPLHAKELSALLVQSLRSYEERFGTIREGHPGDEVKE
jgi:hypothetical protein